MSAFYCDDIETIERKRIALLEKFETNVQAILIAANDPGKMEIEMRWHKRTPKQWLRKEIVTLASIAGSWCRSNGSDIFGGEASDKSKAMRQCLIVEMKTWLAAYRRLQSTNLDTGEKK